MRNFEWAFCFNLDPSHYNFNHPHGTSLFVLSTAKLRCQNPKTRPKTKEFKNVEKKSLPLILQIDLTHVELLAFPGSQLKFQV